MPSVILPPPRPRGLSPVVKGTTLRQPVEAGKPKVTSGEVRPVLGAHHERLVGTQVPSRSPARPWQTQVFTAMPTVCVPAAASHIPVWRASSTPAGWLSPARQHVLAPLSRICCLMRSPPLVRAQPVPSAKRYAASALAPRGMEPRWQVRMFARAKGLALPGLLRRRPQTRCHAGPARVCLGFHPPFVIMLMWAKIASTRQSPRMRARVAVIASTRFTTRKVLERLLWRGEVGQQRVRIVRRNHEAFARGGQKRRSARSRRHARRVHRRRPAKWRLRYIPRAGRRLTRPVARGR